MAAFAARWVASPTRTVPGAATHWSRDAVLTRSPATMPWLVAPIVTAASPVRTPARAWIAGTERADAVDQVERGADGALGVVLVRDRRAPDGHDRVADELLDRAAVAVDDLLAVLEVARQELAHVLGVAALGERREADEVGEQDGDQATLRHGSRGACDALSLPVVPAPEAGAGVPHTLQNRAPSTRGVPQPVHPGGHRRTADADRTAPRLGLPRRIRSRSSATECQIREAGQSRCMTMQRACIVMRR